MPLPLIPILLGGLAIGTGAHGIKKGIDAKNDMDLAKSVNSEAQDIAKKAEKKIEDFKSSTTKAIEIFGKSKIEILSGSINQFVISFEQIKNVDFQESEGLDELKNFNPQSPEFLKLKKVSVEAKNIAVNGIGALGSGALLALGTYKVVMGGLGGLLVTATTGTSLGTLSGAVATKATLAWLGGGALTAGGFGMTGGIAVLGGLVAGPALAIGGSLLAKQADKAYWDAHTNREKAKAFAEQANGICVTLNAIQYRAEQLEELLRGLDKPFNELVSHMQFVIRAYGTNWKDYSNHDKQKIYNCVQLAQMIKFVLDTALLGENGELTSESGDSLQKGTKFLQEYNNVSM